MTRTPRPPIAVYSALADTTRCRIVEILLTGPIPVHKLADFFTISRPAISRHLRVLKTAGLVAEVKKGRENLYTLRKAKLGPAAAWIEKLLAQSPETPEQADAAVSAPPAKAAPPSPAPEVSPDPVKVIEVSPTIARKAIDPAPVPAREKPLRPIKVEPPVNQMGFDF
jgi:DNA-binding transcriptional ArsR family regulator